MEKNIRFDDGKTPEERQRLYEAESNQPTYGEKMRAKEIPPDVIEEMVNMKNSRILSFLESNIPDFDYYQLEEEKGENIQEEYKKISKKLNEIYFKEKDKWEKDVFFRNFIPGSLMITSESKIVITSTLENIQDYKEKEKIVLYDYNRIFQEKMEIFKKLESILIKRLNKIED